MVHSTNVTIVSALEVGHALKAGAFRSNAVMFYAPCALWSSEPRRCCSEKREYLRMLRFGYQKILTPLTDAVNSHPKNALYSKIIIF